MDQTPFRVRVPATTANLGPGFDCLGMALDLWNEVHVEAALAGAGQPPGSGAVSVEGQGSGELPEDTSNLVHKAMEHLFGQADVETPAVRLNCRNEIPLKRGLGSSAAAIIAGLVAANHLLPHVAGSTAGSFPQQQIRDMAVSIEGHPDNVAAALLGGLRLVAQEGNLLISVPVPVPDSLRAVLFIPELTIATEEARSVLPRRISMEDAVYNMGRAALLVNALATGRLEDLRVATGDRLHQPYRQRLFPAMKTIFAAALEAGALGVFLSGSGSSILALTSGREMTVAYEMAEAARQASVPGAVKITGPTSRGAHVVVGTGPGPHDGSR